MTKEQAFHEEYLGDHDWAHACLTGDDCGHATQRECFAAAFSLGWERAIAAHTNPPVEWPEGVLSDACEKPSSDLYDKRDMR